MVCASAVAGGSASTGSPMMKFAKATPKISDTTKEPIAAIQSKVRLAVSSGCLARYSKATPRTINPIKTRNKGR